MARSTGRRCRRGLRPAEPPAAPRPYVITKEHLGDEIAPAELGEDAGVAIVGLAGEWCHVSDLASVGDLELHGELRLRQPLEREHAIGEILAILSQPSTDAATAD